MRYKALFAIFAIAMTSMLLIPAYAWSYGDPAKADDLKFERFGPRADRLLIKLYTSQTAEWDTGLETGQIDVTDWPMDFTHYDRYTQAPWTDTVKVLGYGAEFGCYLFDLNNNNNQYLGNPPNPAYPNPVYPNPMSDVDLRKAVGYLANRPKYVNFIGATTVVAIYTLVGPSSGKYSHPDIKPGGAREDLCYLYNPAAANDTLDAGGFPLGPDGWRYWDKNGNSVKDAGEDFNLKVICRVDDPNRDFAGSDLSIEMTGCRIPHTALHMPSGAARTQWMTNKNGHIYTAGWSLTVDPDFLILWNWDFYWHPGNSYNTAGCNVPDFNTASYGVMYANDQAEAVVYSHAAQLAECENEICCPLWVATGFKSVKRAYTGTPGVADIEDIYEGDYWNGYVNVPGFGVDGGDTFSNMYPEGHEFGGTGDNMTIRYGFKTQEIKTMNAIYAEWLWDNTVIGLIGYDSLLLRNSYNLGQFDPWLAQTFTVGTYTHPAYGTCTKVRFTLKPGAEWSDGTPVTLADIFFTFVEMDDILIGRGLPPPWWYSNVMNILSFSILDPYNFEVLLDVKTVFATGWIGGNRIMPKHIWKPICISGDPTTFAPDPNMINSGAWRLEEYVENSHVLLTANTVEKTVDNNLAGSTPVTSDDGHFRWTPIIAEAARADRDYKLPPDVGVVDVTLFNLKQTPIADVSGNIRIIYPDLSTSDIAIGPVAVPAAGDYAVPGTSVVSVPALTGYGKFRIHVDITWGGNGGVERTCPITGEPYKWHCCLTVFWATIAEDIAGSTWYDDVALGTYPYKGELVTADFKVDIKDVARASGAFGSYPGHIKWNTVADITGDYKIDIKDLAKVSAKFGWHP